MTDKDFNDLKKKVEELERKFDKQRLNNLSNGLSGISAGTVNTGDTTSDTVINNLRTDFNKLVSNIEGQ